MNYVEEKRNTFILGEASEAKALQQQTGDMFALYKIATPKNVIKAIGDIEPGAISVIQILTIRREKE